MGVLQFDGVNEQLKWTSLATALANTSDGAWTLGLLGRISDTGHFNGWAYLLSGAGAGTARAGISYSDTTDQMTIDVGSTVEFPSNFLTFTDPAMFVISKGAGTVTPRMAWKLGASGGWTHENASGTLADQTAAAQLQIGTWQDTDFFEGWLGVVAFWEGAMSDANKEALDNNWRTSDWWASAHGRPTFLVELNVAAANVVDLAGNASSLAIAGTPSLDAGETLNDWFFDATGTIFHGKRRSRMTSW